MANKHYDFDTFMSEMKKETKKIKIFGKEEEFPSSLPAKIMLMLQRANETGLENMSEEQSFEIFNLLFGKERFNRWLSEGMTLDAFEQLVPYVLNIYVESANAEVEEKAMKSKKPSKKN